MKNRIDKVLVEMGLAVSRSQAAQLVKEGVVFVDGEKITKASQSISSENIEVRKEVQFVSRGAHKIEGAIERFDVNPDGYIVADVGASTGGFTDFLLKNGALKVYAIDVGHDQLATSLREDKRVINLEGVNIRHGYDLPEKVDLVVADLSYISLRLVIEEMFKLAKDDGKIITLVKPQFEVGKDGLSKGGIVKDSALRKKCLRDLFEFCEEKGIYLKDAMQSPIKGKTGNIEYLFYFDKSAQSSRYPLSKLDELDGSES